MRHVQVWSIPTKTKPEIFCLRSEYASICGFGTVYSSQRGASSINKLLNLEQTDEVGLICTGVDHEQD